MQVQHENIPPTGKALRDAWLKSKNLTRLIERAQETGNGGVITTCAAPGDGFLHSVLPELRFPTQVVDTSQLSFSDDTFNNIQNNDVVILDTREQFDTTVLDQLLGILKNTHGNNVFIVVTTSHSDYIARKLHE